MIKNNGIAQMVAVLTQREINYLVVGLLDDLVGPAFVFVLMIRSSLGALFAFIRP